MQILGSLEEIPDGAAKGYAVGWGPEGRDVLVVRRGSAVYGYVNECPHAGTPLDWVPDGFMSADGRHLLCATHGALFRVETGACIHGPCLGRGLARVPVRVADGMVVIQPVEPG